MDYEIECIDETEVMGYLGFRQFRAGQLKTNDGVELTPEVMETLLEVRLLTEEIKNIAKPRGTFRRVPLTYLNNEYSLLSGELKLSGRSITNHLKDSTEAILISGTLGISIDQLLRNLEVKDIKKALMMDSVASVAIENILDQIQADLRRTLAEGEHLTDRFAPGYGDLPLELNGPLSELLDTKRKIGLTVTSSGIMIPRKSILAIIGVADREQRPLARGCSTCRMIKECNYSKGVNYEPINDKP